MPHPSQTRRQNQVRSRAPVAPLSSSREYQPKAESLSAEEKAPYALAFNFALSRTDRYIDHQAITLEELIKLKAQTRDEADTDTNRVTSHNKTPLVGLDNLWSAVSQWQKSEPAALTDAQRRLYAAELVYKVNKYRNFFSHFVSGSEPKYGEETNKSGSHRFSFYNWLEQLYKLACNAHSLSNPPPIFVRIENSSSDKPAYRPDLTPYGTTFMLSLLLTRSQMSLLLNQAQGYKNNRKKTLRNVMLHYCISDSRVNPSVQEPPGTLLREIVGYLALPFDGSDAREVLIHELRSEKATTLKANLINKDEHNDRVEPFAEWKPPTFREDDKFVIYALKLIDQLGWFWSEKYKLRFWSYRLLWKSSTGTATTREDESQGYWAIERSKGTSKTVDAPANNSQSNAQDSESLNPYTRLAPAGLFARCLQDEAAKAQHIYWLNDDNIRFELEMPGKRLKGVMHKAEFANLLYLRLQQMATEEQLLQQLADGMQDMAASLDGSLHGDIRERDIPKRLRQDYASSTLASELSTRIQARIKRCESLLSDLSHNTKMREARRALRPRARTQARPQDFVQTYLEHNASQLGMHEQAHEVFHLLQRLRPSGNKFGRRDHADFIQALLAYNGEHSEWCKNNPWPRNRSAAKPVYDPLKTRLWKLWSEHPSVAEPNPQNPADPQAPKIALIRKLQGCARLHDLFEVAVSEELLYLRAQQQSLPGMNPSQQEQLAAYLGVSIGRHKDVAASLGRTRQRAASYLVLPRGYWQRCFKQYADSAIAAGLKEKLIERQSENTFGRNIAADIRRLAAESGFKLMDYYRINENRLNAMSKSEGRKTIAQVQGQHTHDALLLLLLQPLAVKLGSPLPTSGRVSELAGSPIEIAQLDQKALPLRIHFEHIYQQKREWFLFRKPHKPSDPSQIEKLLNWAQHNGKLTDIEVNGKLLKASRIPELRNALANARLKRLIDILTWEQTAQKKLNLDPKSFNRSYLKLEDYLKAGKKNESEIHAFNRNRNAVLHDDIVDDFDLPVLPTL